MRSYVEGSKIFVGDFLHLCKSSLLKVDGWKIDLFHIE